MEKIDYKEIKELISSPKKIVLTSHTNPDGDAIGSSLALLHFLKKLGHTVNSIVPNDFPEFYQWMPGSDEILVYTNTPQEIQTIVQEAEIIFCLDYNTERRTGVLYDIISKKECIKILIDHHLEPDTHFQYSLSDITASSTGELIYRFIENLGMIDLLDKDIASSIYTSIITDTGSFSYAINTEKPFKIASELYKTGIDIEKIQRMVYDTFSEDRLRLLGFCLTERLIVLPDVKAAIIYLSKEDLNRFNYKIGDTEGVVNYPLSMKDINLSCLISEKNGQIRLSFRSKGDFSVNELTRKHFDGGGHKNAAGGTSKLSVEETLSKIKNILPLYKEELDYELKY